VRGTGRAGSTGGPWRGRVRRRRSTYSTHTVVLTDHSKSQLAIQYAHSIRDASPQTFVFWVHANTHARFEEAYRNIADRLELPGKDNPKADVLRLVHDWLRDEANGRWVMVIDNVDNVEAFFPSRKRQRDEADASAQIPLATYLPQSHNGTILVTSRSKDAASRLVGGYNKIKEVLVMDEGEGLQLLRNKLQDPPIEESAVELLHALNHIPLAITQAAAYINRRARITVAGYLDEFWGNNKKRESLLNWDAGELRRDESASNSVVITWQMSFERIRKERQSATDLLSLMSFFNPQGIPESTLQRYSRGAAGTAEPDTEDEADSAFNEDLDTLQAYSLVAATANSGLYKIHALVQFCTRVWLSSNGEAERWKGAFVELMAREFPSAQYKNWTQCQQLLPHVESLYNIEPSSEEPFKGWAHVLTNTAGYLWMKGSYQTAQVVATKAVTARERVYGLIDNKTLTSVSVLALVMQSQGKYEEAEMLNRRVLERREKEPGTGHPDTLANVSNLALVLQYQGKYEEAEELNRRALEGREKELGPRHPSTLASISNLALVMQYQGKYEEAEELNRQALEGREKELGPRHPSTLTSVSNLVSVLRYQGKYEEAEMLSQRALEGREKELGPRHPSTLASISNLALAMQYQGKYEESEELNRRALQGREKVLELRHPSTLASVNNLALVLQYQGKYEEAENLSQRALEGREKELGAYHPDTLASVNNLALVLQYQGKYKEAERLNRRALEGRRKELRARHPDTLTSMSNLASVLRYQGKYKEAEELSQRALEEREKELGPHHPSTLASVNNLALVLQFQGKYEEAEMLSQRALEGREKELGPRHPNTLASVNNLALVLQYQGKYEEAEELNRRALEGREKELGPRHPSTLASVSNLASVLWYQGKYDEAEKLNRRALERRRRRS
jgi:tetratricopeptide (TPR) repeat protein